MVNQKIVISCESPILSGTVYISRLKCGTKSCSCALDPTKRHKVYQWSGNINNKNTTRTLTKEMYLECKKRIVRYKKFKKQFVKEVDKALKQAPWTKK